MITQLAGFLLPKFMRTAIKKRVVNSIGLPIDLMTTEPWSSPNVWEEVARTYQGKSEPRIFEFGCGCSTLQHLRNLLDQGGGTYDAVDHNPAWFSKVCGGVVELALQRNMLLTASTTAISESAVNFQFDIRQASRTVSGCLHWRRPKSTFRQGDEGRPDDFYDYIRAIGTLPYDLIVIDGRARNGCVQHVLDQDLIANGGTVALFEAGRGTVNWLGKPTLTGDADYQPSVQRLIQQGGRLVDGIGFFSWPSAATRYTTPLKNPKIPMEACILTKSC